jgi:hypothetical protein
MKPRLFQFWLAQTGRCFFCDGDTLFYGRAFADKSIRSVPTRHDRAISDGIPHSRAVQATLATLARECDGGDRSWRNLAMACRFCFGARQHPFAMDHRAEMQALIRYGAHPLHGDLDREAAA